MIISFKSSTRHAAQFIVCGFVLFALLSTSVVSASTDATSMCKDMASNAGDMMMHESMSEEADCCQVDVMPDCCKTCHISVHHFSPPVAFSIDKPEAVNVVRLIRQHTSLNPPPLLRPPVIS